VATGVFKSGDQLPTIRALSERLNVNPNTVAKAYRELELKGIIVRRTRQRVLHPAQPPATTPRQASGRKKTSSKTFITDYWRTQPAAA